MDHRRTDRTRPQGPQGGPRTKSRVKRRKVDDTQGGQDTTDEVWINNLCEAVMEPEEDRPGEGEPNQTWSSPSSTPNPEQQSPPYLAPTSPDMISIPPPPAKALRPKRGVQYKDSPRECHSSAEQKRRSSLNNNFDLMHELVPSIRQSANAKISKAAMLQKGAEYIEELKSERQQLTEEAEKLKTQIENLSSEISNAQAQLPATGAPMLNAPYGKLKEMFASYVKEQTLANWKFWIFSLITEPLLESFNTNVRTSCHDDLCRSSLAWLDQQCSLNALRPLVSSSMRKLSITTNVLDDPESLSEEVFRRVKQKGKR